MESAERHSGAHDAVNEVVLDKRLWLDKALFNKKRIFELDECKTCNICNGMQPKLHPLLAAGQRQHLRHRSDRADCLIIYQNVSRLFKCCCLPVKEDTKKNSSNLSNNPSCLASGDEK